MNSVVLNLETIKQKTVPVLENYPVDKAILFGSYAKDKATVNSDVDLYVVTNGNLKAWHFLGLIENLTDVLGVDVNLTSDSHLDPDSEIIKEIVESGILIYEKDS